MNTVAVDEPEASILIVDDEASVRESLTEWFSQEAWRVETAVDANEALAKLSRDSFHVALLDIRLPGMDGLELQRRIRKEDPKIAIILMTAYASVETAVCALKEGAYDYITKPFQPDEFTQVIRNALQDRALTAPTTPAGEEGPIVVGRSAVMREILHLADTVADTDSTVILHGESGTGKELIARRIHEKSRRRFFPFVPVNCGGMSESLLESELFGHEKGAFTGAFARRKGRIELADQGTLFLDEIGEIPGKMQVDLLRVIEDRKLTRIGGETSVKVDFRILTATHRNLLAMIEENSFRRDLYYRLNVVTISIPPLRERREDIPLLADHFLAQFGRVLNRAFTGFSPDAVERLVNQEWKGNIRELRNVVERASILATGPEIEARDLFLPTNAASPAVAETITDVERAHIVGILHEMGGNISQTARRLGIDRGTLYRKMERYGLRKAPPDSGA